MQTFVDVIMPLPLAATFTYSVPDDLASQVARGSRVIVPFGRKKIYTAIVENVHFCRPEGYEVKDIYEVLDSEPILLPVQFKFWNWIAEYYLCTKGEVYKAAVPSGLKLESETLIELNPEFVADAPLPEREQKILDLLSDGKEKPVTLIEKELKAKSLLAVVKRLLEKEAVFIHESVKRNYKPKTELHVRLSSTVSGNEKVLNMQIDALKRAPKQQMMLLDYLSRSGCLNKAIPDEVSKKDLLANGASTAAFASLVEKGIFETYQFEIGRLRDSDFKLNDLHPLSEAQQNANNAILGSFMEKNVCLFHGVTSSGKTEVYIHLIQKVLEAGKQALYLLPEIALTTQITERLRSVFGNRLGIYHSKYPDAERVEIWNKMLSEKAYDIVVGVRSSVFLPFRRLGLVIVDEEHETTYKQQDPAPRYHARNSAIVLASMYGAKTLLGTATPCLESFYNAATGKYAYVELNTRYKSIQLPEIKVVDIKDLRKRKLMTAANPFSPDLLAAIREALENKEQVILFQNRRGYAPVVECNTCGWVPRCKNCDVSLTYHKGLNMLTCHYCGYTYQLPQKCPACEGVEIRSIGFGTEKIEDEIQKIFPDARVSRMDLDTTRTRTAYERIIDDFQNHRTDILIGTQMISKGLDFDRVSVVGILNADTMLNYPDFRAYERAFQMMAQVAGRAGRKHKQGRVFLQTKNADLPIIRQVVRNDYAQMYQEQMEERQLFHYPPFYRIITVSLKHRQPDTVEALARDMAQRLRSVLGERVLGPDKPAVARIQLLYIRNIVIKIENNLSLKAVREHLLRIRQEELMQESFRSAIIYYDVDPM